MQTEAGAEGAAVAFARFRFGGSDGADGAAAAAGGDVGAGMSLSNSSLDIDMSPSWREPSRTIVQSFAAIDPAASFEPVCRKLI